MDRNQARRHSHMPMAKNPTLQAISDYFNRVAERNRQQTRSADPLGPLSQLTELAKYTHQGLKDIANIDAVADDIIEQGYPSAMNALHMGLGPAMGLQGKIAGGALKVLPIEKVFGSSIAGDAASEALKLTAKGLKKAAAPVAGGLAALPAEAEGGVPDTVLKTLVRLINEGAPTLLRPVGQRIGQAMPKEIAKQQLILDRELFKLGITPEQNENIVNIFNRQEHTVEEIIKAVKEVLKGG